MKSDLGFTLIEILIALFIFALISSVMVTGLFVMINARQATHQHAEQLADLQIIMTRVQQDFEQIIDRAIIDNNGQTLPAVLLKTSPNEYIEFTRSGFVNPLSTKKRSTLQRVAYHLDDGVLIRQTWPVLDRQAKTQAYTNELMRGLSNLQIRILNDKNQFVGSWPNYNNKITLPKAVEIQFCLTKGCITRLLPIAGSSLQAEYHER